MLWQHLRCGCDALQIASAAAVSSDRAALPSEQLALKAVPSWCQYVPAEYRPVACRGSSPSGCICASFCKDTAADSWSNNPNRSTNDRMRAEHYASGFCAFDFGRGSGSRKHRLCLGKLIVLGTGPTVHGAGTSTLICLLIGCRPFPRNRNRTHVFWRVRFFRAWGPE